MEVRLQTAPNNAWLIGIAFAALFAAMRFVGVLGPLNLRWVLPLGFTIMALLPFLLLTRPQRREMGLKILGVRRGYLIGIVGGAAAAFACFALGTALFGSGEDNWFVSIANNYRRQMDTTGWDLLRLHLVFTIPPLIFSPIGEEIFFRGYLQYALERRFSARVSTVAECAAFAVIHLCHHGLYFTAAGLSLRPLSGAIWMVLTFGAAMLFAWLRKYSGSLLPAIVSHAVFNLVMNVTIIEYLWHA
jgi:membrane protease YdiL (CAAX protease family)